MLRPSGKTLDLGKMLTAIPTYDLPAARWWDQQSDYGLALVENKIIVCF